MHRLTLASASPRRSELLRQIGVGHLVSASTVDDARRPN
jgi:predicted house-cleaning NTP pyrophosphatase (Maf/HAM1 superfamily)